MPAAPSRWCCSARSSVPREFGHSILRSGWQPPHTGWNGTAGCHRNHQIFRWSARPPRGVVLAARGRGACAARGERGREVHADQSDHRRREGGFRHPDGGRQPGAAQQPGRGACHGNRGGVPAARAVPGPDGGREHRTRAGESRRCGGESTGARAAARRANCWSAAERRSRPNGR